MLDVGSNMMQAHKKHNAHTQDEFLFPFSATHGTQGVVEGGGQHVGDVLNYKKRPSYRSISCAFSMT